MKLKPVSGRRSIHLDDSDAHVHCSLTEDDLQRETKKYTDRISALQHVLYADARYALLIVLQGRDASGKDGTIRKVFSAVNPQGCNVASFKAPTELEQHHDFLWRIHQQVPHLGMIGIFNRSHYEDILVPRVHGSVPKKVWTARYAHITAFEAMLAANNVVILKFLLHISRDEQKRRLADRLTDREKNWKFRKEDLDDRELWGEYTRAYRGILANTHTGNAPWYIVPADDKDVRNLLIARTIAERLAGLRLRYPPVDPWVAGMKIK
ncbi:MAG: polyphosphate kinase 2 family protein [Polaromonas sp.]|nr:polyphosphate kinase 2 family protein [Gemmatimonadaceae bacterium]